MAINPFSWGKPASRDLVIGLMERGTVLWFQTVSISSHGLQKLRSLFDFSLKDVIFRKFIVKEQQEQQKREQNTEE